MFTGLIEEIGVVKSLTRIPVAMISGALGKLVIASEKVIDDVSVGDSVSVSGVCLTVTSADGGELSFDAVPETLARSALGGLRGGDKVNLEASLKAGKAMGGHFVLGHVDGVGVLESVRPVPTTSGNAGDCSLMSVSAPPEVMRYVVEKGSVALDGISLTVASCEGSRFTVAVIPHTLAATTLHLKRQGDKVNLEADIIGKYVEKFVGERVGSGGRSSGVTEDVLRDAGFT